MGPDEPSPVVSARVWFSQLSSCRSLAIIRSDGSERPMTKRTFKFVSYVACMGLMVAGSVITSFAADKANFSGKYSGQENDQRVSAEWLRG